MAERVLNDTERVSDNYLKRHSAVKKHIFKRNDCDIPNTRDDNYDYE